MYVSVILRSIFIPDGIFIREKPVKSIFFINFVFSTPFNPTVIEIML